MASKEKIRKLVSEVTERYKLADTNEDQNRRRQLEDERFTYDPDGQWEESVLNKRKRRPNYTFNRSIGPVNQVIGDQRQNSPSIKVRGIDSESDPDTADVFTGLIRNIEDISDAETAYDTAFKHAVVGGYGVWRVMPEFVSDDVFDQDLKVLRVANPLTCYSDPTAKDFLKRDANWWIITERVERKQFERDFPDAHLVNLELSDTDNRLWFTDDEVRIAEYFRKIPKNKTLALLSDGAVIELTKDVQSITDELKAQGITIKRTRVVRGHIVEWMKLSGDDILEGPIEYNWKYIPVIPVYGRNINIEGEELYEGIVRHSKDAQRVYNYQMSTAVEVTAIQPRAPYMSTARMIKGYEEMYRTAGSTNRPYMLYNIDPDSPREKPTRDAPPDVPVAMLALAEHMSDNIKSTTGFFDPSLGQRSNETSGKAIIARQREGDVGSFEYVDNLAKARKFTGEILVDMIPQIYDTERQLRIIGQDGKDEIVTVNTEIKDEESGKMVKFHDLRQGKYDVKVTLGPSYTTQRQEAADMLIQLAGVSPMVAQVASDLIIKNLDLTGADELEKRLRGIMIRQGIIQPTEEDKDIIEQPDEKQQQLAELMQGLQVMAAKLNIEDLQSEITERLAKTEETKVDTAVKVAEFITKPTDPKTSVSVS